MGLGKYLLKTRLELHLTPAYLLPPSRYLPSAMNPGLYAAYEKPQFEAISRFAVYLQLARYQRCPGIDDHGNFSFLHYQQLEVDFYPFA